jgi:hypothetical protein
MFRIPWIPAANLCESRLRFRIPANLLILSLHKPAYYVPIVISLLDHDYLPHFLTICGNVTFNASSCCDFMCNTIPTLYGHIVIFFGGGGC